MRPAKLNAEAPMAGRRLTPLALSDEKRLELKALAVRRKTSQALVSRARIMLACAEGNQNKEAVASLGSDEATVGKWRRRLVTTGI
jgi:hypothetical protein